MQLPSTGKGRVRFLTGRVSEWQAAKDIELGNGDNILLLRGDTGECSVMVPLTSVLLVEYATDEEVKKMEDEAKKKAAAKARTAGLED